jgi:hypothetical protein
MVSLNSDKNDHTSVQLIDGMLEVDTFPVQLIGGTPLSAVTNDRMNYEVFHVATMDETKLQEAFNHPSLIPVGFVHLILDQVSTPQTNGQTDSSSNEDEDDSSSPPVLLPRRGVLSAEQYESFSHIVLAYRSLSLHEFDHAGASLLPPMPRASTPEELLMMFDDDIVPEDDTPLVFSIVTQHSSMNALTSTF